MRKLFHRNVLCFSIFLLIFLCPYTILTVHAAKSERTVCFIVDGKVYLEKKISKNDYISLPKLPKKNGYTAVGWTEKKDSSSKNIYSEGKKLKISEDKKLYAVYDKNPVVNFYCKYEGKTVLFKKNSSISVGKSLKVPSLPSKEGYVASNWYTVDNGNIVYHSAGKTMKIEKNVNIYTQFTKTYTINLYDMDGKLYKKKNVKEGGTYKLPSLANNSRFTFMGWSLKPYQTLPCAYFEAEEKIDVHKDLSLYPVMYKRKAEEDLSKSDIPKLKNYSNLILVGDSRTARTEETLVGEKFNLKARGISFVAKSGEALSWLKKEGMKKVLKLLSQKKGKTAIVFNLGVNSLSESASVADAYIKYMNKMAPILKEYNVDLFYMSVNPLNSKQYEAYAEKRQSDYREKHESVVREFNQRIKSGLGKTYTYIDSYSYLMKYGYVTTHDHTNTRIDDGLHYTSQTYKKILSYVIKKLND